jgi:hypothetical protein
MKYWTGKVILSMVLSVWTLSDNSAHTLKPLQIHGHKKNMPVFKQVDLVKLKIDASSARNFVEVNNHNCTSITKNLCDNQPTSLHKAEKNLPDKIITSKRVLGRFVEIISGDYFYARISTKYGEKIFLIDSNEDCFLRKHPKEKLSINYDVIDRYTTQANGYRRVNVIREITTRKTSLKKWRMILAKNKLSQCQN